MKDWQSLLVDSNTLIREAIEALDKCGQRIVLVINENQELLGTVTDGDVRRALIKQVSMENPVCKIMCRTPKVAFSDWSTELIKATMENHQLLQIPIIDSDKKIVGLHTVYDVLEETNLNNPVLIIAGGFGTRLHPLTENCPKPLLKINGKPILELTIERLINAGFHKFFISTHFKPDMIKEHFADGSQWGVDIRYVYEPEPLGTAGSLSLLPQDDIDLPLLVMNADLLTALDYKSLLEFHTEYKAKATICVREYEHQIPFGVMEFDGANVTSIQEKPLKRSFINAGIYLLNPEILSSVKPGMRIDMPDLLQKHIQQGAGVNMFPIHEYWLDIGRMDDFKKAQLDAKLIDFNYV